MDARSASGYTIRMAGGWTIGIIGGSGLYEIDGLEEAEAPDIDQPLLQTLERLLEPLIAGGFTISSRSYGDDGTPRGTTTQTINDQVDGADPLIVVLADDFAAALAAGNVLLDGIKLYAAVSYNGLGTVAVFVDLNGDGTADQAIILVGGSLANISETNFI